MENESFTHIMAEGMTPVADLEIGKRIYDS